MSADTCRKHNWYQADINEKCPMCSPGVQGLAQLGRNALDKIAQLEADLAAMTAERDAALVDAERLDWVERHLFGHYWSGAIGSLWSWTISGDWRHTVQAMRGNTFRVAIDAARKGTKEGG